MKKITHKLFNHHYKEIVFVGTYDECVRELNSVEFPYKHTIMKLNKEEKFDYLNIY